jgi:protein-tyrosine phosphatase
MSSFSDNLRRRYGRRAGALRHYAQVAKYWSGAFSRFEHVDWGKVRRVVFVCNGNICRSPYAECKARSLGLNACSFGLHASPGLQANQTAVDVAARRGIDLSLHRTSAPENVSLSAGDLVAVMEPAQLRLVRSVAKGSGAEITILGLWRHPRRPHLEDPFGLPNEYFETCFKIIDEAVARIAGMMRA